MELRQHSWLAYLTGILLLVLLISIFLGRPPEPLWTKFSTIWKDDLVHAQVIDVRLPRLVMAVMVGAALAGSGYVLQMLLHNPLAAPGLLSILPGAAFGAALAAFLPKSSLTLLWKEISAILFAVLGLALSYWMARHIRFGEWILRLLLAGIMVSTLFIAGIGLLNPTSNPETQLPGTLFWLLGGLWNTGWREVLFTALWVVPALFLLYSFRRRLNLLSIEEDSAFTLGSSPELERLWFIALAIIAAASVTAVAGMIFWIGLVFPFWSRRLFGADARRSFLGSMLGGALFLLGCDDVARIAVLLPANTHLGILTSIFGAIAFGLSITNWKGRSRK